MVMLVRRSFIRGARSLEGAVADAVTKDAKEDNARSVLGDRIIASICRSRITRGSYSARRQLISKDENKGSDLNLPSKLLPWKTKQGTM